MLVGRDESAKMQTGLLSYGYNELPATKENTLYIDSVAVSPKLRGLNIAKILLDNVLDVNKKSFTDVFLGSTPLATKFYEKNGFTLLDTNNPEQKIVFEKLKTVRNDIDCLTFYHKPLQLDAPRWYSICANACKKG